MDYCNKTNIPFTKNIWGHSLELLHPLHDLLILWLGEISIVSTGVPRVARVKPEVMRDVLEVAPDRPETSLRNGGSHLCHVVHQHLNTGYEFLRA